MTTNYIAQRMREVADKFNNDFEGEKMAALKEITECAKQGRYLAAVYYRKEESIEPLAEFLKSLGFKVEFSVSNLVVSWEDASV